MNQDPRIAFRLTKAEWIKDPDSVMGAALANVATRLHMVDGLLTCVVLSMEVHRFNDRHLIDGVGHLRPVLSLAGEITWNALTTLGLRCVAPGQLFALILHPAALDAARAVMAQARAA